MIFFFFSVTATSEIYTLSLHDALPIWKDRGCRAAEPAARHLAEGHQARCQGIPRRHRRHHTRRSEEHTSELQSPDHLVCRLLLEKKKKAERTNACLRTKSMYTALFKAE